METESVHQSVSGDQILLRITQHGSKELCREYTVERQKRPLNDSVRFKLLSGSILLFGLCLKLNHLTGLGVSTAISLFLIYSLAWEVKREDLLVIAPVGMQLTATFRTGQQTTCFIPWQHVKDILIIEAISLHRVLFNIVVYTTSCPSDKASSPNRRLVPLFQGIQPRLECLEHIYRSINELLPSDE